MADIVLSRKVPIFLMTSLEQGIWTFRLWRGVMLIKAPWNRPLFSERYGHVKLLPLGFGWRVLFRTAPKGF